MLEQDTKNLVKSCNEETNKENENMSEKTKSELLKEINDLKKELRDKERYEEYGKCADEMLSIFKVFEDRGFSKSETMELLKIANKIQ